MSFDDVDDLDLTMHYQRTSPTEIRAIIEGGAAELDKLEKGWWDDETKRSNLTLEEE